MKFELVFRKSIVSDKKEEEINVLLTKLFGENCKIDWRDNQTVEIRSTEVSVYNIDYEKD